MELGEKGIIIPAHWQFRVFNSYDGRVYYKMTLYIVAYN